MRAAASGNFAAAETIFQKMVDEDPTSASAWSNLGNVRLSLGKAELAVEAFDKATSLAPNAPVPFLNRAIAKEALGMYELALADCEVAIR